MTESERLGLLAHELRSPVAALMALAAAAPAADDPWPMTRLGIAAGRDVDRLLRDGDPLSLRRQRIDLAALARGLVRDRVEVDVSSVETDADPTRLRQLLANLVANGLRHGTSVTVTGGPDKEKALVEVADDGPGLPAGLDPFARGVSGAGSTGYGLWLAREIAEAHGGSLELVSSPVGARFRLALPRASGGG